MARPYWLPRKKKRRRGQYLLDTYSSSSSSFWGGSGAGVDGCFCTILIPPALTVTVKREDLYKSLRISS